METSRIKSLLALSSTNQFCIQNEKGEYSPIEENANGKIKSVMGCIAQEILGEWPLSEENEKLFKTLTCLKYQPTKKSLGRNKAGKTTDQTKADVTTDKSKKAEPSLSKSA